MRLKDPILENFMIKAKEMELAAGPPPPPIQQEKIKKKTTTEAIKEFNSSLNPLRYYTFTDFNKEVNKSLRNAKPQRGKATSQERYNSVDKLHLPV